LRADLEEPEELSLAAAQSEVFATRQGQKFTTQSALKITGKF
jgi:hypothetical protein